MDFKEGVNYEWKPNAQFTISGQEFADLYHLAMSVFNTGAAPPLLSMKAHETSMNIFKRMVGEDRMTIVEVGADQGVIDLFAHTQDSEVTEDAEQTEPLTNH